MESSVKRSNRQLTKGSPPVIVVGSGIAGLAAARALYDASFQVLVLVSRDRIGGGIHTDYSRGFPFDLRASCYALFDMEGNQGDPSRRVSPPVQYPVSHLGTDSDSLGSYGYDIVGKPRDLYEMLQIPVDDLFFTGEAMSTKFPGSDQSEFSMGLSAADDCRKRALERYGEVDLFQPVLDGDAASAPVLTLISRL